VLASRHGVDGYFQTAIADAAAVTRKASPLQAELWASLLTSAWLPEPPATEPLLSVDDDLPGFIARAVARGDAAAHVMLAALAVVGAPEEVAEQAARGAEQLAAGAALPEWASWLGRVHCDGAWSGPADLYGDQDMDVLSFGYDNAAEPHVVAMLTDNLNGGLAVHAFTEDPMFLDRWREHPGAGQLRPVPPGEAAGRILAAFELTDHVVGVPLSEELVDERSFVLARARAVRDPVRPQIAEPASDDMCTALANRFWESPYAAGVDDEDGAEEAFGLLLDFVGGWPEDRLLWWSPNRVSMFLTHWLPRKAIMSDQAVRAMTRVVAAWTNFAAADLPEPARAAVIRQVEEDLPKLRELVNDPAQAGLAKQIALGLEPDMSYLRPDPSTRG